MKLSNPHVVAMRDTRQPYRLLKAAQIERTQPDYYRGLRDALADVARAAAEPREYIRPKHRPSLEEVTAAPVQGFALDRPKVYPDERGTRVTDARLKQRETFNVHDNSRDVRTPDDRPSCKLRPENNRPKHKGGGGGSRKFIPWCSR